MTTSEDLVNWSTFQLIDVAGVDRAQSQVYFLTTTVVYVNRWIVGYFPGILQFLGNDVKSTGVHITWSQDGHFWTPPDNVFATTSIYMMHPVGILNRRLLTQEPLKLKRAFKLSQEYGVNTQDMRKNLSLAVLGEKSEELLSAPMEEDVVYDQGLWDE